MEQVKANIEKQELPLINVVTFVLDDQQFVLDLIKKAFDEYGIDNYLTYTNTDDFLSHFDAHVNIAVIDHYLGGELNGIDILKMCMIKNEDCYVIMMSGTKDEQLVIDAMELGCRHYIKKEGNYAAEVARCVKKGTEKIYHDFKRFAQLLQKQQNLIDIKNKLSEL
jgi:DNA-binding NarL/FixJ family response regulator